MLAEWSVLSGLHVQWTLLYVQFLVYIVHQTAVVSFGTRKELFEY